jgi:hypothetical protein
MNSKSNTGISVLVVAVASVIMLGIGFWQMWKGYEHIAGSTIAFWASLAIVIILFFTNMLFRKAIVEGEEKSYIRRLLVAYLIFTLLSFSGNFNAFYSYFMNDDLISNEIIEKNDRLHEIQESAKVALTDKRETELTSMIKEKKSQLAAQFRDPQNKGIGPEANKVLKETEGLLGNIFTRLSNGNSVETLVTTYNGLIDDALETKLDKEIPKRKEKQALVNDIDQKINALGPKIAEGQKLPKEQGLSALLAIVELYKEIGNKTSNLVTDFKYNKELAVENERIGTIPHSFSAAWKNSNKISTWFIVVLSLFIDLGVPIFTFLITKTNITSTEPDTIFKPGRRP